MQEEEVEEDNASDLNQESSLKEEEVNYLKEDILSGKDDLI